MDRTRLALLICCALLTTGIQPFARFGDGQGSARVAEAMNQYPDNVVDTASSSASSSPLHYNDRILATQLFARLSRRHTGLPAHERSALAHAIVAESRAQNLDPDLVIAVIEVESAGYALAVSRVGALGLMQLLPSTAEELAGKHGVEWMGDHTLFDPVVNVKLGTAYLRQLADHYDDVNIALAAYNWGPGRIDGRIRRGEAIPSKYIQQVMQAYERSTTLVSNQH